jgi:Enoyl-CoA hydratase/carnithine racemase
MNEPIRIERHQRVLVLRFNRPDKKNALTQAMYGLLADALDAAAGNPQVRAVLFSGAGDTFTSGNDIADFLRMAQAGIGPDAPVARFMRALTGFPKPLIAAVEGAAIGIGSTLLLHTDLVYCGRSARLQFPFVSLGLCAEFASSYLLPQRIGHARAAELLLFGEPLPAARACELGLVNAVVDDGQAEALALERALVLAEKPPKAVRTTRALMHHWQQEHVEAAIRHEAEHFFPLLREGEAMEAMSAFMQKRKPDFSRFE